MLEYFLTAYVPEDKIDSARAVLQGVCAMSGVHQFKRVLFFEGPDRPDGFKKIDKSVKDGPNGRSFAELQRYLAKQSFAMRLEYPIGLRLFGSGVLLEFPDKMQGTLFWSDIPEPVKGGELHIRRKILSIENQDNLVAIMRQNSHTFKTDSVEESYIYALDNVEYRLKRYLLFPEGLTSEGLKRDTVPPLSEFQSPFPYWYLHLKVLVPEATPELSNLAVDMLTSARRGLGTCFEFQQVDRRMLDTRMSVSRNDAPQQLGKIIPVEKRG